MSECEYVILDTYNNNPIKCNKNAVYTIENSFIMNKNMITDKRRYCSKHAETLKPFTKLKRINDKQ